MTERDSFAIVGYGYRLPGGIRSDADFWRLLSERDFIREPIFERYGRGFRPLGAGDATRFASGFEGLMRDQQELLFDCKLFGISLNEAKFMDPQIKLLLTCAWETFENAGWEMRRLRNSPTGVFLGTQISSASHWRTNLDVNEFLLTGRSYAMLPNRISYHFNLMGPSFSVNTACSSGMSALHAAVAALRQGDCQQALFGAVNYLGDATASLCFNALGVISGDGKCHSFDAAANGYMRSEGAVLMALKPLADAERDGDRIHAVVQATALNAAGSADDALGLDPGRYITAPTKHSQVELMRAACARAGLTPSAIDYVEAHATGTQVGDPIEGNAIGEAFGGFEREGPLRVASVKSNVGHMESAAFACSLLKVVLMMQRRTFAPISQNFAVPNPKIDFAGHNMRVQTACAPFPQRPVVVGINSFGFGGANGHCVIREYRPAEPRPCSVAVAPDAGFMIPLSARTPDALARSAQELHSALADGDLGTADLYTLAGNLSCRRTHFGMRAAFAANTPDQLIDALDAFKREPDSAIAAAEGEPRLIMVFSGQGTQWAGCGQPLYDAHPVFRRVVDAIESHWLEHSQFSLREACFSASPKDLDECRLAQPVIFMLQCALVELLKTWGVHPDCVVGHSAGEVAAAYACGALSLDDATRLIFHRSRLQQLTAGSGRMLAIGLDRPGVEDLLDTLQVPFRPSEGESPSVAIACENAPASTVICGKETELEPVLTELSRRRLQHGLLRGNIAFHSPAMDPIKGEVLDALSFLDHRTFDAAVPFVSSVTGEPSERLDGQYWWANIRQPVRFAAAMDTVRRTHHPDILLEIAPHSALQPTIRQCFEGTGAPPAVIGTLMRNTDARISFNQALGELFRSGVELDFASQYPRPKPIAHLLPGHPSDARPVIESKIDEEMFVRRGKFSHGPLVGRAAAWGTLSFEAKLSGKHFPHLLDHRVNQAAIMPAAGYMELVMEALGGGGAVHFDELEFLRTCPIPTHEPLQLQTRLHPVDDGEEQYTFTIESRPYHAESAGELHCRGSVRRVKEDYWVDAPRRLDDIDRTRFKPTQFEEPSDFYDRVSTICGDNFDFGPTFQTVQRVEIDIETKHVLGETAIDEAFWKAGREEGYLWTEPLLDSALQLYLVYLLQCSDFSAAPKAAHSVTLFRPPSAPRLTCLLRIPEAAAALHEKGQFTARLGHLPYGSVSLYDSATGDLVGHVGDYTTFNFSDNRADLRLSKHFVSWQPKFLSGTLADALPDGEIEPAALIAALEQRGSDGPAERACHVVEFAHGLDPHQTLLAKCIDHLDSANSQSEYWLLAADDEQTRSHYEAFHHHDAALRFECHPLEAQPALGLDRGLLRPAAADVILLHGDINEAGPEAWLLLRRLAIPGGLALVSHGESDSIAPGAGWTAVRTGQRTTLLQAPQVWAEPGAADAATEAHGSRWVIGEAGSLAQEWLSFSHREDASRIAWESIEELHALAQWAQVADLEAVDFFCAADASDPTGEGAVTRLVAFVQVLIARRIPEANRTCRLTVVTRGAAFEVEDPSGAALWGAVRSLSAEVPSEARLDFRLVDVGAASDLPTLSRLSRGDLRERELAVRRECVWVPRVHGIRDEFPSAPTGDDFAYRLFLDRPGQITGLRMKTYEPVAPGPEEVEIEVSAAALNFRDVMVTLDLLPPLSYERSALGREVGMEASGFVRRVGADVRRCRVGDEVVFLHGGCIANRIVAHEGIVFVKPARLSLTEAAAGSSAYLTAYYALVHLARLQEGESVLIHSGMGGVGQAAVAMAKHVGARIYATAGSQEKRDRLLAMGVSGAFDSHSHGWHKELMQATGGEGVDVVLNSLAGHHLKLSLEALRPGGRHCEIGKIDIYADNALGMRVFRKNLSFFAVDVDRLILDDARLARELAETCLDLIGTGAVPALPVTTYGYRDAVEALRLMMNGQHQGKLVLTAPPEQRAVDFPVADERPLLDSRAAYLVTGGLGGFGLRMVAFLVASGARHLTLMDRDPERRRSSDWVLQASGLNKVFADELSEIELDIVQGDVAAAGDVERCVAGLKRPLKGVFHLAGTLDDRLLADLSPDSIGRVFAPKARGALNLHRATAGCALDHFVLFSSTASMFGNPGQVNYSAANGFLDGLAAWRHRQGLPALSYNMAAVTEAGMASRSLHVLRMMKASGMPPVSALFTALNLDYAMRATPDRDHLITCLFNRPLWRVDSPDYMRSGRLANNMDCFIAGAGDDMTVSSVVKQIVAKVAELCGHDEIAAEEPLSSFGFSSISVAELGAFIQTQFGYQVGALELMTTATAESLAQGIVHGRSEVDGAPSETGTQTIATVGAIPAIGRPQHKPSVFANRFEDHFPSKSAQGE